MKKGLGDRSGPRSPGQADGIPTTSAFEMIAFRLIVVAR